MTRLRFLATFALALGAGAQPPLARAAEPGPADAPTRHVRSVAELKAVNVDTTPPMVVLRGYFAENDGGGDAAPFYWDAASSEATNRGTIFQAEGHERGRWKRVLPGDRVVVNWFGARGDGSDDQPAIQDAVDYLLKSGRGGTVAFRSGKTYTLRRPVLIGKMNRPGTDWTFVSGIALAGESPDYATGTEARLLMTNPELPALIIQLGRNITVRNLSFHGQNQFLAEKKLADQNRYLDDTNFVSDRHPRLNRYSPHAAIVTDPFQSHTNLTGLNATNQYPGLGEYYLGGSNSGTFLCSIDHCHFADWSVGVMMNPSPGRQQGDSFSLRDCVFTGNRTAISIGQSQSRSVALFNCTSWYQRLFVSTTEYGQRAGCPPQIFGGEATGGKYLFDLNTSYGVTEISGFYAEDVLSLGWFGYAINGNNLPVSLSGSWFKLRATHPRRIDHNGAFFAPVTLLASGVRTEDRVLNFLTGPESAAACAPLHFDGAWLQSAATAESAFTINAWHCVQFDQTTIFDLSRRGNFSMASREIKTPDAAANDRNVTVPGTSVQIGGTSLRSSAEPSFVSLGNVSASLVLDGQGGARFTAANPALLRPGDVLCVANALDNPFELPPSGVGEQFANAYFGVVGVIEGATVRVKAVPQSLRATSGIHTLNLTWIPRFHQATTGDAIAGSKIVLNVSTPKAWAVGDHLRGGGIVEGSTITAIEGTAFTLSVPATATTEHLRLFDADVRVIPTTPY